MNVLVTGCNGGIGKAICKLFKEKKWNVIGIDIHNEKNNMNIDKYFKTNLINENEIINLFKNVKKINCLINCAAIQICKPIWEYTSKEWDDCYNCNVKSIFLIIKYGINIFKKFKTNIINISSIHSSATSKNISCYASTKACIVGLTKNMAIDLAEFGIRVNSISPGAINTKMLISHISKDNFEKLKNKHLLKNIGQPKNIADTCWFILNNNFINGSNLIIDGGILCQLSSE